MYPLPYRGGTGLGKPLKSIVHPLRSEIPIMLGAEGPKNVALAAEIADGWFPLFFSPMHMGEFTGSLEEGFARPGAQRSFEDFEVMAVCPVLVGDGVERVADALRPWLALYIGGMGAEGELPLRRVRPHGLRGRGPQGPGPLPRRPQGRCCCSGPDGDGRERRPLGPKEKIRDDLAAWKESIATTLLVSGSRARSR